MSVKIFESQSEAFRRWFEALTKRRELNDPELETTVVKIVKEVKRRGDKALIEFTRRFDGIKLDKSTLRIPSKELSSAYKSLDPEHRSALELAAQRICEFHRRSLEKSFFFRDSDGVRLGQIVLPLRRVGIYVPGGQATYPSTVLMTAIPAKVAGVEEIAIVSPLRGDLSKNAVLAAAHIAGVSEVYRVGGAQAIAALAYGTETIAPVDKIVGPGNAFVQTAKKLVFGKVDIDAVAGPSEVLVIADDSANPKWVAADLIAQAEHGSGDECAVLLTPSKVLAAAVRDELELALKSLPRAKHVRNALKRNGALVVVESLAEAVDIANAIAPEHLELEVLRPLSLLPKLRTAGAIFVGSASPAPLGDYIAGPNHVLPTGGTARFASPLGVYDFVKRSSIIEASSKALEKLGHAVISLARLEGLEGHARAIELRLNLNRTANTRER